jgi:hypothetical protein
MRRVPIIRRGQKCTTMVVGSSLCCALAGPHEWRRPCCYCFWADENSSITTSQCSLEHGIRQEGTLVSSAKSRHEADPFAQLIIMNNRVVKPPTRPGLRRRN